MLNSVSAPAYVHVYARGYAKGNKMKNFLGGALLHRERTEFRFDGILSTRNYETRSLARSPSAGDIATLTRLSQQCTAVGVRKQRLLRSMHIDWGGTSNLMKLQTDESNIRVNAMIPSAKRPA